MWLYISKNYLVLKNINGEVGSSAMPHKINPIDFENAEGNLKLSANMFHTIGSNICLSRLQRDLTDSTLLRNIGSATGHMILAIKNIYNGLQKIDINNEIIINDLENNSAVVMEFIQLKLKYLDKCKDHDIYDLCKEFSRGEKKIDLLEFFNYLEKYNINFTEEELLEFEINFDNLI